MKPRYTAQLTVTAPTLLGLLNSANAAAAQLTAGIPCVVDVDLTSTRSLNPNVWTTTAVITVTPDPPIEDPEPPVEEPAPFEP